MTFYDWFIICVAIPAMVLGFSGVILLWAFIIHDIWRGW